MARTSTEPTAPALRAMIHSRPPHHCQRRRPWAWLVVLVAVWSALASPWTHARIYGDGPPGMTVCSTASASSFMAELDPDLPDAHSQPDHCRFCLQATDPQVPPPVPPFATSQTRRGATAPGNWRAFSLPAVVYANAAPRGPPLTH